MDYSNHHDTTIEQNLLDLVELIQSSTCLNEYEARTLIYYAIATHGMHVLQKIPAMVFLGPGGTGKTTLLEILFVLVLNPVWIESTETSKAVMK